MDSLKQSLTCPICLEICKDAVECHECHNVFCKECAQTASKIECSLCRKYTRFVDAHFARRLISNQAAACDYCKLATTRGDLHAHVQKCALSPITCCLCKQNIVRVSYLEHLHVAHQQQALEKAVSIDALFDANNNKPHCFSIQSQINPKNGKKADLGPNGKYYCMEKLDGEFHHLLNRRCKFEEARKQNCSGCMELDIRNRNLPKGWLVNIEGFPAKQSPNNERFYCGRRVVNEIFCGPDSGKNCHGCDNLDNFDANNMYSRFLK